MNFFNWNTDNNVEDINIKNIQKIATPQTLKYSIQVSEDNKEFVKQSRNTIKDILERNIKKKIVVIGPCSIHDPESALEYAERLSKIIKENNFPNLFIVMRVYFEKPRTITGWKGLIMDPNLDNSCDIKKGLEISRSLMIKITNLHVPIGLEFLDTISPQYISDLVSWGAIGARTSESQLHRQLASGLSMPIGFKNNTEGNVEVALHSILSARASHTFLGVNNKGMASIVTTKGNKNTHVILRGGKHPNYYDETVNFTCELSRLHHIKPNIMIDCSHGNSLKQSKNQIKVVKYICDYLAKKRYNIIGIMIESNIFQGKQKLNTKEELEYGISITDECVGWPEGVEILKKINSI